MAYTTVNKSTDYFNTKLYTGNGSTNAITGVGFQPDWLWLKDRSAGGGHILVDAVRGNNKSLSSQDSNAEVTRTDIVTAFNSDGFTLGADSGNFVNVSGNNGVAWNWKAGTTGSGTSSGSGTGKAYSYSVSTTSGFSVVKYTGNGTAGHTIPHHLGAVPKMIIAKNLGRGEHWRVYHASLGNAHKLSLNNTTASASASEWNSTTPTSSVFSIGTGEQINYNDDNYIAYCFAEKKGFSKFGSYTGTGSTLNLPFIYTGFKPNFVMVKKYNSTEAWVITDLVRDNAVGGGNGTGARLQAQSSAAEDSNATWAAINKFSNGFQPIHNDGVTNGSGDNYIFMAFAEAPLVGSNNVPANARW